MEPLRALTAVPGSLQVGERRAGGGRQHADAFRRALEQEGAGHGAPQDTRQEPRPDARSPADTGVAPGAARGARALQREASASRKDDGKALHVDVLA